MKHFLTMFIMLAAALALHAQTKMIIRDVNILHNHLHVTARRGNRI